MRYRLHRQITDLYLILRMGSLPLRNELLGQLTRYRTLLAGAAFNNENTGHGCCLHLLCAVEMDTE